MIDLLCFIDKYLRLTEMQSPGSIHYSNQVRRCLSHFGTMFFRSVCQESRCTPFRRCVLSFLLARWQESNGWMRLRGWWIGALFARYEARWVIQWALPADSIRWERRGRVRGADMLWPSWPMAKTSHREEVCEHCPVARLRPRALIVLGPNLVLQWQKHKSHFLPPLLLLIPLCNDICQSYRVQRPEEEITLEAGSGIFFSSRNLNAPWNSGLWEGWVFASSCSSLPSSVGVAAATPQDSFPLLLDTPPPPTDWLCLPPPTPAPPGPPWFLPFDHSYTDCESPQ